MMQQPSLLDWTPPPQGSAAARVAAARFAEYDRANPRIWTLFVGFTFEKIEAGHEHFSADAVLHRIRWESPVHGGDEFKVNNNFSSWYARKFAHAYPAHASFFRQRAAKADRPGAKAA
jgi:hypothetical protein